MQYTIRHPSFAELFTSHDVARKHGIFQVHPTQVAAKEVVKFTPSQSLDAAIVEADRKIAAGESLLPGTTRPTTAVRRG